MLREIESLNPTWKNTKMYHISKNEEKNHVTNWTSDSQNRLEHPFPVTLREQKNRKTMRSVGSSRRHEHTHEACSIMKQYDFTNTPTHTSRLQQIAIIFPIEQKTIQRDV